MHGIPTKTHVALLHVQPRVCARVCMCVFKGQLTHVGQPVTAGSWELMDKHSLHLLHSETVVNHLIRLLRWSPNHL